MEQSLGSDNATDFADLSAYTLVPTLTTKSPAIISFPYFNYASIKHSDLALPSTKFYRIGLPLAMQTSIPSSKNIGGFIIPIISSDLSRTGGKNFNVAAALFIDNSSKSKFIFRYGIYYGFDTNGHILIPAFNVD